MSEGRGEASALAAWDQALAEAGGLLDSLVMAVRGHCWMDEVMAGGRTKRPEDPTRRGAVMAGAIREAAGVHPERVAVILAVAVERLAALPPEGAVPHGG